MKIVLTTTLNEEEHAAASEMLAAIRHLGLEHTESDVDGRRWLQVGGFTDEDRLTKIVALLDATRGSN